MKVRDLIEKLKQFDPDDEVFGGVQIAEEFDARRLSIDDVRNTALGCYSRIVLIDMEDR